jgi:adenylate cyclase
VRAPPLILIADDNPMNLDILQTRLAVHGYQILVASDGEQALAVARERQPDLILLDVMMPKCDGIEVCRRLREDPSLPFMPIILVTAKSDSKDIVAGLEAGGDEYLTKPVDQAALVARVKSALRIKALHDTVQEQNGRLAAQSAQLSEWNQTLSRRVAEQLAELERVGRLRRFFSPQIAELIVSSGNEKLLESHRREITVVFCDLSGFTVFSESAEPEEVMGVLREFHAAMGELISRFEGTLAHFVREGLVVFFNDPLPCPDAPARAVRMALAMRQQVEQLAATWRKRGHQLGLRVGIALGYATLGTIGFEGRFDYGAIGPVMTLTFRICDEARTGQILISQRVHAAVENLVVAESVGNLSFRGFLKPVPVFNVLGLVDTTSAGTSRAGRNFEECPSCGTCYDAGTVHCPLDDEVLTAVRGPRLLAGRYRTERRLGRGGMGTVYQATDLALERQVAVKVIRDDLASSDALDERFRKEALAEAGFAHPNIVTVHDFGVVDTRAFLVMELLEGISLREELRQQKRLPASRCLEILSGVCAGVDALHQRRLVHRDLKPENIFLARAGTESIPKVLDFGIAKFLPTATDASTQTGAGLLVGTLQYMAPEQLCGEPVDAACDLWALAVVAYEMLTGAQPFPVASVAAVLSGQFTPVAAHLPDAPASWQDFFVLALAADPGARGASARRFYSELERIVGSSN